MAGHALWACMLLGCLWSVTGRAAQDLSFALGAPFLHQSPLSLDRSDRQRLDEHSALRVGISIADYEPIDITADRNRYQGVSADYLSLISAKLDIPVRISGFAKREQAVAALLAGEVDVLTSANGYERGIQGLAFTPDYLPDHALVVGRGSDPDLSPALTGKRIALLDGYADADVAHQVYPNSEIILAPTLFSAMEALAQGDVDVFIGNEVIVRAYMSLRTYMGFQIKFESSLPVTGFSFAVRQGDSKLLSLLNRSLADLGESIGREIQSRWTVGLGADVEGQRIQLSTAEQLWAGKNAQVTVASSQHPPYIYKDESGQWVGLNIDVLSYISRMTGLTFVHQVMPTTQAVLDALSDGTAEMNTTLAENTHRRALLNFSYAYGGNNWIYVVRADRASPTNLSDLSGKVLAMPARHALLEFIQTSHPGIELRLVPTYQDARKLVEDELADATIQNEAGAWLYPLGKLKMGRSVEGRWSPDRFAVIKTEPELLSILNKALSEFPVAEMRAIRTRWLGAVMPQPSIWERVPGWVYWAIAVASLLVVVSLIWSSRLKVQITQRQRAEEQLSDQLAFKHALLDGIPNPIYVRDLKGRLISCNRSYEQSLGLSFDQMNGRRLIDIDLIPSDVSEQMHADYMTLLQTQEPAFADRSLNLAGRQIEAWQWTVPFHRADGNLQGLLGGWMDISERKKLEQALTLAQEKAEQANEAKSQFLITMSHDIRTPMGAIIGLLELEKEQTLRRGELPSEGLGVALRAARELVELIGESLDLAKIEAGSLQLSHVATEVRPFFEEVCQLFKMQAEKMGVELKLQVLPEVAAAYYVDPLRLRQILHNLIGNALKFTLEGRVSIGVMLGLASSEERPLQLQVIDTGIGMSIEQQARLFRPFSQGNEHTAERFGGSGLGMSICKQLVELMQGRIDVVSEAGRGTQIDITLPLHAVPSHTCPSTLQENAMTMAGQLRILLVDDLSANRMVLTGQLQSLGHGVTAVGTAKAALLAWTDGTFDAVITDCNMPDMDGYALTRSIRDIEQADQRPACPIIGCTANAMSDEGDRCEQAGMDGLLIKPVSLARLAEELAGLVRAKEAVRSQFDINVLHKLTQANEAQLQLMLAELWKNLWQERYALEPAVTVRDWESLSASLHRLKGVAGLIDAVPLAKRCAQLGSDVKARNTASVDASWQHLDACIEALLADIEEHLHDAPTL